MKKLLQIGLRKRRWAMSLPVLFVVLMVWGGGLGLMAFSEEQDSKKRVQGDETEQSVESQYADVLSVKVTGQSGAYRFSVEVASPDTGCDQYADWWEVLTEEGDLVYRRVLLHSHVGEQPFVRSGGPVAVEAETVVIVRAHMHPDGYGGRAMKGTAKTGFSEAELVEDFALDVEKEPPLPDGCAF